MNVFFCIHAYNVMFPQYFCRFLFFFGEEAIKKKKISRQTIPSILSPQMKQMPC